MSASMTKYLFSQRAASVYAFANCKTGRCSRWPFKHWSAYSTKTQSLVSTEKLGSVQLIAINRPDKRNAVDPATAKELFRVVKEFEDDKETSAAVLYGKGGVFCAGYDLTSLSAATDPEAYTSYCDFEGQQGPMGPTRYFCSKPVIAAIEGYAVAGGMELALWCDLRVMETNAIMGVFCRRFGVPLIDGGTVRLPKLIGLSRAMDLILTGREVKAKEAFDIGLVNAICDTGSAVGRAVLLAQEISKFPPECMRTDRESAYYSMFDASSTDDALRREFAQGLKLFKKEAIPGAKKFVSGIGRHGSFNLNKIQDEENRD